MAADETGRDDESSETDESTAGTGPGDAGDGGGGASVGGGTDSFDVTEALDDAAYVAVAFAVAGVGFGAFVFLLSQFGADATVLEGSAAPTSSKAFTESAILTGLTVALFVPLFLAPVAGLVLATAVEDVRGAVVAAAVGLLFGAFFFYVLAGLTSGLQFPTRTVRGTQYAQTFVLTNGAIDGILLGIVSGAVAGVSAALGQLIEG